MGAAIEKDSPSDVHVTFQENLAVVSIKQRQCDMAKLFLEGALTEASKLSTNRQLLQNDVREKQIEKDADCHEYARGIREAAAFIKEEQAAGGPSKHFLVAMLGHLGDIYRMDGNYEAAEQQYAQAMTIARTAQDTKIQDIAGLFVRESNAYVDWKHYPQAEKSSIEALAIMDAALWKTDPSLKEIIELRLKTCKLNNEGVPCKDIETRLNGLKNVVTSN